jgi:hypothetical protein
MYNIIKEYRVGDYAHCMWKLYDELNDLITSKFPDGKINFDPEERIVFWHDDLDYFIDEDFPGFSLYNLQLILRDLDIPNFACAIVSNMPDYDRYTKLVRDILRPDDVPMRAITQSPAIDFIRDFLQSKESNKEHIQCPFIVMSRLSRFHRTVFMSKLFDSSLHTKGMVSYHNIPAIKDGVIHNEDDLSFQKRSDHPTFLSTVPFTLYNSENTIKNIENIKLVNIFSSKISSFCNFTEDKNVLNKGHSMQFSDTVIQKALVYIGLETAAKYPTAFQSNISFKGISQKRLFIIFGSPGCIKLLKDQGFQTFDRWWDESYDDEQDLEKRLDMIIEIIKHLAELDVEKLHIMFEEMQSILEYNHQHFISEFVKQEQIRYQAILDQQIIEFHG